MSEEMEQLLLFPDFQTEGTDDMSDDTNDTNGTQKSGSGKPRTVQRLSAKEIVKIHMALGGKSFANMTSKDVGKWMGKQIGRPITYGNVHKLIKEFGIKYAVGRSGKPRKTKVKHEMVYSLTIDLAKIVRDLVEVNADKFGDSKYKEVRENLTQLIARRRVSDRGDNLVNHVLSELVLILDNLTDDADIKAKLTELFDQVK